jgi:hypothetical protein
MAGLSLGIAFQSCKKDENPVAPQPVTQLSKTISVVIKEPSSDGCYVTTKEKIPLSGMVISEKPLKDVKWKSSAAEGTATGLENWAISEVSMQEGDNIVTVTATDNSDQIGADTIILTKNRFLNFLCQPQFSPSSIPANQATNVTVNIEIEPVSNLDYSSVKLFEVDGSGSLTEVANLYDDGDLSHGDDIKGDNFFSNIVQLNGTQTGVKKYRVTAQTQEASGPVEGKSSVASLNVYEPRKESDIEEQKKIQNTAADKIYESFNQNKDLQASVNSTVEWLKTQPNVKSAEAKGDRAIMISYSSGEKGAVVVDEQDENGKSIYLGGGGEAPDTMSRKGPSIKLMNQTRGTLEPMTVGSIRDIDTNLILNKKVLIWAPYEDELPINIISRIQDELSKSTLGLKVTHLAGLDATVQAAKSFSEYGLVIIFTHGYDGLMMLTKEEATPNREYLYQDLRDKYKPQILIATKVTVCRFILIPLVKQDVYYILPRFILSLNKNFPKSVILNISCQSAYVSSADPVLNLALAFIKKGASNYFGYTGLTNVTFANSTAPDFIKQLTVNEKNTRDAYTLQEATLFNNTFRMFSAYPVRYTSLLINGDFEFGDLVGWDVNGDARIITGLGSIKPYRDKYMGIISTGLGFTTSSGEFTQTFRIHDFNSTLSMYWNFLSEELLEYIGSGYQDVFRVTIKGQDGSETVLLEKSVDKIAAQFGATKESAGSLQYVSPGIKFDRGDVYATGWVSETFDVSKFKGQTVTLTVSVGDVGDSSYDTAVLLDDISVD